MFWRILPNLLTVLRLLAGLAFPFVSEFWWLPLMVYAGASDLLDGWLSRRWNGASTFGQVLDPIADKTFVLAALWTVWRNQWLSLPELLWLASRDLMVLGLTATATVSTRLTARDLLPRWPGKVATAAQFIVLTVIVYRQASFATGVVWGGVISALAAADYGYAAWRAWQRRAP